MGADLGKEKSQAHQNNLTVLKHPSKISLKVFTGFIVSGVVKLTRLSLQVYHLWDSDQKTVWSPLPQLADINSLSNMPL